MTPRELSTGTVTAKLAQISELLDILDTMGEVQLQQLRTDAVLRLALERVLTQLVELAASTNAHVAAAKGTSRATGTYRESFALASGVGALPDDLATRLAPSAGLRNILVHSYADVDWQRVVDSIPNFRTDYRDYVRHVARWLQREAANQP